MSDHEGISFEIKKALQESNTKMINQGVQAHHATLIDEKEIRIDGNYATQIDFQTISPNSLHVTYISFFHQGYAFTITYGSADDAMLSVMDDAVATIKLK